jgi:hypothetical protein
MTAWPNQVRAGGELRRMSRRFSTVGVNIPPSRLREIAAGAPATEGEWVDVSFALVATNLVAEQKHRRRVRAQKRLVHWALVGGAIVIALNALLCLGLLFFVLTEHPAPM